MIADGAWKEVTRVQVQADLARIETGLQRLTLKCEPKSGGTLKWEVRTYGPATVITATRTDRSAEARPQ